MSVYYGVSQKQALRRHIIRDLIQGDIALPNFARHRARAFLTGISERERILDELAHLEAKKRERIMRKKLTPLDRALSDRQAANLNRALSAWLVLNGKSKSVNPEAVGGGDGDQKLPLSVRELSEAHAFSTMKRKLEGIWKDRLEALCWALAPWRDECSRKLSDAEIDIIVNLSEKIMHAYAK